MSPRLIISHRHYCSGAQLNPRGIFSRCLAIPSLEIGPRMNTTRACISSITHVPSTPQQIPDFDQLDLPANLRPQKRMNQIRMLTLDKSGRNIHSLITNPRHVSPCLPQTHRRDGPRESSLQNGNRLDCSTPGELTGFHVIARRDSCRPAHPSGSRC
jgi:hypothetical protein